MENIIHFNWLGHLDGDDINRLKGKGIISDDEILRTFFDITEEVTRKNRTCGSLVSLFIPHRWLFIPPTPSMKEIPYMLDSGIEVTLLYTSKDLKNPMKDDFMTIHFGRLEAVDKRDIKRLVKEHNLISKEEITFLQIVIKSRYKHLYDKYDNYFYYNKRDHWLTYLCSKPYPHELYHFIKLSNNKVVHLEFSENIPDKYMFWLDTYVNTTEILYNKILKL